MVELRMTSFNGKVTIIPVVTTPNANARRRALIERHLESDVDHEIKRRCNTKKKFCYHTFDEIVAINKPITVLNKRYVYILFMASSHIYIHMVYSIITYMCITNIRLQQLHLPLVVLSPHLPLVVLSLHLPLVVL